MTTGEPSVFVEELMAPPPRVDALVTQWTERMKGRARYSVRVVAWVSSVPALLVGLMLAAITDADLVTRVVLAFVPWLVMALPIMLVIRYANGWNVRQVTRFVRDGVAHPAKVERRWYAAAGGLLGIRAAWVEDGRVVVGSIELWGERDIDETTEEVTVLAIPGERYVAALIGRETLAIGKVKKRTRLVAGDSMTSGVPSARVLTSRDPAARLIELIAFACIMLGGCHKDHADGGDNPFPWAPRRAEVLQAGPYKVKIPTTWRALSESLAKDAPVLPAGTVGMTPEGARQGAYRLNILLTWGSNPSGAVTPCDVYAKAVADAEDHATVSHLKSQTYPDGPGCSWEFETPDGAGLHALRVEHDHLLMVSPAIAGASTTRPFVSAA